MLFSASNILQKLTNARPSLGNHAILITHRIAKKKNKIDRTAVRGKPRSGLRPAAYQDTDTCNNKHKKERNGEVHWFVRANGNLYKNNSTKNCLSVSIANELPQSIFDGMLFSNSFWLSEVYVPFSYQRL